MDDPPHRLVTETFLLVQGGEECRVDDRGLAAAGAGDDGDDIVLPGSRRLELAREPRRERRSADWIYLWTVPAMQGLLRQFGKRSVAAIYSVFVATSLLTLMRYADWRPITLQNRRVATAA